MAATKLKRTITAEEAAEIISEVALGLSTGDLWIESNGKRIRLHPSRSVKLDLKSEEGTREGKLTIEVSWKTGLRIG
ncbi:MAG: amphi-Trp domain-containing protein [Chloroflexi bacterium]|nr:amphi-Trp domain-containing protein [Chloroflexota bacterium]